jgi:hypothetical protein
MKEAFTKKFRNFFEAMRNEGPAKLCCGMSLIIS